MNQKSHISYIWMIFVVFCILSGCFFRFALVGHELIGYILFLAAVLIVVYHLLQVYHCRKLRLILTICIIAGITGFMVVEMPIISASRTDPDPESDYLIVLGAGVNGTEPSLSLLNRLEAALDYLDTYPTSMAIVTGGQGSSESITEAEAMRRWLESEGIEPGRIIKEEQATNTEENLQYSFDIIRARGDDPADGVAIVSSEYHLYRAKHIAESLGAKPYGVAGETTWPLMKVNYFIREGLAAIYMYVFGT
jgi:uncharacterized SAM-binding protein YcdF (DUF218 family)